jgi:hypothetical protein
MLCNACWSRIEAHDGANVFVTPCLHAFCLACASKNFEGQARAPCPACQEPIGQDDLQRKTLTQSVGENSMQLWGLTPVAIVEIAASAINFFDYQKRQEVSFLLHQQATIKADQQSASAKASAKLDQYERRIAELTSHAERATVEIRARDHAIGELQRDAEDKTRQLKRWSEQHMALQASEHPQQQQQPHQRNISMGDNSGRAGLTKSAAPSLTLEHVPVHQAAQPMHRCSPAGTFSQAPFSAPQQRSASYGVGAGSALPIGHSSGGVAVGAFARLDPMSTPPTRVPIGGAGGGGEQHQQHAYQQQQQQQQQYKQQQMQQQMQEQQRQQQQRQEHSNMARRPTASPMSTSLFPSHAVKPLPSQGYAQQPAHQTQQRHGTSTPILAGGMRSGRGAVMSSPFFDKSRSAPSFSFLDSRP